MGVYPSAASQIQLPRDPTDGIRSAVSLRGMMQQQAVAKQDAELRAQQAQQEAQLRTQQIQQGQAAQQDQEAWRKAYQDSEGDPDKTMAQAMKNGASAASIEAFQRHQIGMRYQIAQITDLELRNLDTKYGHMHEILEPLWDEVNKGTGKTGQESVPPQDMTSGAHPGRVQSPVSRGAMMQGKGAQWQGDQPGAAEQLQRKQDLWSKQRELLAAHPEGYGITDLSQIPEKYPGDDAIRMLHASLAAGKQLVQQDMARRRTSTAVEGTIVRSPTGAWIRQQGEWVPYYGKLGEGRGTK